MKSSWLLLFLFWGPVLCAQKFTEIKPILHFEGVRDGSIAFSDTDGDGDEDVLITGGNTSSIPIAKLYLNNGGGSFSLASDAYFEGVRYSSVAFSDVDGDNDNDVFIIGINGSGLSTAKLYLNQGDGIFVPSFGQPFLEITGSAAFSDVDGDGDADLITTGASSLGYITKLYLNNGEGDFTDVADTSFEGGVNGSIAFSDVDGDGDEDVCIAGHNGVSEVSELYINDGAGNFSKANNTPFEGVSKSSIAFSDIDGDNDNDLLITGRSGSSQISKLYLNDGLGHFTLAPDTPFEGIESGSVAFSDVDGDGDNDLFIIGLGIIGFKGKLFLNDGSGHFTLAPNTPFESGAYCSVAFSDVDGDNDSDLLIAGVSHGRESKLYLNDGTGYFDEVNRTPFDVITNGSVAFSDVDGDNDNDLLITGLSSPNSISKLYLNDEKVNFYLAKDTPFIGIANGSVAFSDVDGDNDEDLVISGSSDSGPATKLYFNNGLGDFTEAVDTSFISVYFSSVAFSDVDGDNDNDLLIAGRLWHGFCYAVLYLNDGVGNFSASVENDFEGVSSGSIAFSDIDGDDDNDLIITGLNGVGNQTTNLYFNNGEGHFTKAVGATLVHVGYSSVAFSDVDGDNDNDLLITGTSGYYEVSKLYINDGNGNFSEVIDTPFDGVRDGSVAFSDVDGDNDNDLLITGSSNSYPISKLYINDGNGNFSEFTDTPFDGVSESSIAFLDVDGDNDEDVLITGKSDSHRKPKLFINEGGVSSTGDHLIHGQSLDFIFYPNPAIETTLNVSFVSEENGKVTICIFDSKGRLLSEQQRRSIIGQQTFLISINALVPGSYFIQLDDGSKKGIRKLLIQ